MNTQKTLTLNFGRCRLVLDLDEVIDNDPGAGTPAVVESRDGRSSGTYWCAKDTGELVCGDRYMKLTGDEMRYLNKPEVEDQVDAFLFGTPRSARTPSPAADLTDRDFGLPRKPGDVRR